MVYLSGTARPQPQHSSNIWYPPFLLYTHTHTDDLHPLVRWEMTEQWQIRAEKMMISMRGKWGRVALWIQMAVWVCISTAVLKCWNRLSLDITSCKLLSLSQSLVSPKHRVTVDNGDDLDKHYIFSWAQGTKSCHGNSDSESQRNDSHYSTRCYLQIRA